SHLQRCFRAENSALALASEHQREAYERCLDEVANHVVQALLNQKDLREECINLKKRVFDLERQNRTLTELFTIPFGPLYLSFSLSLPPSLTLPLSHSLSPSIPLSLSLYLSFSLSLPPSLSLYLSLPPSLPPSLTLSLSPSISPSVSPSLPPYLSLCLLSLFFFPHFSTSSVASMSPFLQKKAHILEVLRKLEETDPLKFHPSTCYYYHGQALLAGEMTTIVTPSPRQLHCRHSSSDTDIHEYANEEGDSRASLRYGGCPSCRVLLQRNSLDSLLKCNPGLSITSHSGREDDTYSQMFSEEHRASAQNTDAQAKLLCVVKTSSPDIHSTSSQCRVNVTHLSQQVTKATVSHLSSVGVSCSEPNVKLGEQNFDLKERDSEEISTKLKGVKDVNKGRRESEGVQASGENAGCVAISPEYQNLVQVCSRVFSSNQTSVPRKVVESYGPVSLSETAASAFTQQQAAQSSTWSPSLCGESKPSPVSSPSKLLKMPLIAENTPTSNAFHLSPQLTRSSKIPCRNNYEVYHSPESGYSSHSAPKTSKVSANQSSSQPLEAGTVAHYENIIDPSHSKTPKITSEEVDSKEKQKISLRDERVLSPLSDKSSDSSETTDESPSDHGTSIPSQTVAKRSDKQLSLLKRTISSKPQTDSSYHPFKERLAALGKLKSTEDLQQNARKKEAESARGKTPASTGNSARSKTAERQSERIAIEHQHSKYTDSLDGKPYPKNTFGNYVKGPGSMNINTSTEKHYVAKPDSQKMKIGMSTTTPHETPVVMRSYGKCPNPLIHHSKTVPSPQSSPIRVQSKSPSKANNVPPLPCPRSGAGSSNSPAFEQKRFSSAAPVLQSAIEQKVMRGIEENMMKQQGQDRGQTAETKHKTSNGIASWFGLKKSKLPALNRKSEMSKLKLNMSSSSSSGAKDASGSKGGPRKVVESLNISKLMEKAEDLRKALEEERVYVNGVGIALDCPGRGHSCEVVMDQAQGQLSLMYRGVTADNFMQQLLNRHGEPNYSYAVSSFCTSPGSGSSMRTLDSGIGTFPLPDYGSGGTGKGLPKPQEEEGSFTSQGKHGAVMKAPRKAHTLERELSSLEEVKACVLYSSPLEAKGANVHLSGTIHEGSNHPLTIPSFPSQTHHPRKIQSSPHNPYSPHNLIIPSQTHHLTNPSFPHNAIIPSQTHHHFTIPSFPSQSNHPLTISSSTHNPIVTSQFYHPLTIP
uniref:Nck-associated protein 5 C-terminal domain-containing protein n=1 Tax=Electrophorus electricus TaxID=8005 RepID=A0A4W4HI62_ELEEL